MRRREAVLAVWLAVVVAAALASAPRAQSQDASLPTVVIDPGHGGDDIGVRGASGLEEKQLTLDIAQRLRTLLESRRVARVVLTRDADQRLSADDRAGLANGARGQLFVSLHANAAPAATVSGAEVYYRGLDTSQPSLTPAVDTFLTSWDDAATRHVDLSARAAGLAQEELERQMMTVRAVRHAPLRAVAGMNMPAIVVEMLFLTNLEQDQAAATVEFKDRLALALAEAVSRFLAATDARQP